MIENVYTENGYKNRKDYLKCMSEEYCVPLEVVYNLASLLGKNEDFDGLVNALEDAEKMDWKITSWAIEGDNL
jgi:hypothetical protein